MWLTSLRPTWRHNCTYTVAYEGWFLITILLNTTLWTWNFWKGRLTQAAWMSTAKFQCNALNCSIDWSIALYRCQRPIVRLVTSACTFISLFLIFFVTFYFFRMTKFQFTFLFLSLRYPNVYLRPDRRPPFNAILNQFFFPESWNSLVYLDQDFHCLVFYKRRWKFNSIISLFNKNVGFYSGP